MRVRPGALPMTALAAVLATALTIALIGCGGRSPSGPDYDFGDNDPRIFVAMGDSITVGAGDTGTGTTCPAGRSSFGYPVRLASLLRTTVINEGICGEKSGKGLKRVDGVLSFHRPGYLLILYSPNDLFTGATRTASNLRAIVQAAKENKTIPIIGTLTPAFDSHRGWEPFIEVLNGRIRLLAAEEEIEVADHFEAFDKQRTLLSADGLHPNALGYEVMANTWYEAIGRVR